FGQRLSSRVTNPAHRTWRRVPMAIAAGIALLLAGYGLATLVRDASGADGNGVGTIASHALPDLHMSPQDAFARAATFRQVADVFDGRAQWVMVSNRGADVGIAQRPFEPAGN